MVMSGFSLALAHSHVKLFCAVQLLIARVHTLLLTLVLSAEIIKRLETKHLTCGSCPCFAGNASGIIDICSKDTPKH